MGAGTWHLGLGQDPHNLISKVILPTNISEWVWPKFHLKRIVHNGAKNEAFNIVYDLKVRNHHVYEKCESKI